MEKQVLSLLARKREPLSLAKISGELRLAGRQRRELIILLHKLEARGIVRRLKKRYFLAPKSNSVRGTLVSALRGYAFVSLEDGSEDVFIPGRFSGGALRGDTVDVLLRAKGVNGKPEGRVVRIAKKARKNILGVYQEHFSRPFFLPLDSPSPEPIPVSSKEKLAPRPGMIVEMDRQSGRLTNLLGLPDDPGVDAEVILRKYGLSRNFPPEALAAAGQLPEGFSPEVLRGRKDYRDWNAVTIDGEDAQDFDDAVSIRRLPAGNFLLGVHIADVSHYVRPGSPLDQEAFRRATSVYFPDLTLPMLPEQLSNDLCSLRPRLPRLTQSVLLEISPEGSVENSGFHPSLIQTAERMTYTSVQRIFEGDEEQRRKYSNLVPELLEMRALARLLKARRVAEGSLDFDLVEPELVYREGRLHSVVALEKKEAHQLIEEFMVAANEAVAGYLDGRGIPSLYRIHPRPSPSDLEELRENLSSFGLALPPAGRITSKDLQRILARVEGKPEEKYLHLQVLRALKLAVYSPENSGHFGLAKKNYAHFTSPIRRYPDLVVHRVLKQAIGWESSPKRPLDPVALHCSAKERNADEAEKELLEWRIFRFLKGKLGEEFDGLIVATSRAGLVVELDNLFVTGVVPFGDLKKDHYRKSRKGAVGKRTGVVYELGRKVRVVLASVDPWSRRMSLVLSGEEDRER